MVNYKKIGLKGNYMYWVDCGLYWAVCGLYWAGCGPYWIDCELYLVNLRAVLGRLVGCTGSMEIEVPIRIANLTQRRENTTQGLALCFPMPVPGHA